MKTCPSPPPTPSRSNRPDLLEVIRSMEVIEAKASRSYTVERSSMSLGACRLYNDQPASNPLTPAPHATLEMNKAVIYPAPRIGASRRSVRSSSLSNLTRGIYNGYMSPATKRQIKKAASSWLRSISVYRKHLRKPWDPGQPYPVMITLTLPTQQIHDDREVNRACLIPFIQRLKREHYVDHYLWRAEAQENGNLHYHMIIDRYVDKERLQDLWNLSIDALDYRWRYAQETGSIYPPTTEVHGIREVIVDRYTGKEREVDPVDYLVDYFTDTAKPEDLKPGEVIEEGAPRHFTGVIRRKDGTVITYRTRAINGRLWGMSDGMRELRPARAEVTNRLRSILEEAAEKGELRKVEKEHASLYFGPVHRILERHHKPTARLIIRHYVHTFAHMYPRQRIDRFTRHHTPQDPRILWLDLEHFTTCARVTVEDQRHTFPTTQAARRFLILHERYAA